MTAKKENILKEQSDFIVEQREQLQKLRNELSEERKLNSSQSQKIFKLSCQKSNLELALVISVFMLVLSWVMLSKL